MNEQGYMANKFVKEQQALRNANKEIKKLRKELNISQEFNTTLTNENLELGKINNDLRDRFIKGGIIYTLNDGYVSSILYMAEISLYTHYQEIDDRIIKYINTPRYKQMPFGIEDGRNLIVDEDRYKKFIGGLL